MGIPLVVEHVQDGIHAQKELKTIQGQLTALYIELGYNACKEGKSLEQAIEEYQQRRTNRHG